MKDETPAASEAQAVIRRAEIKDLGACATIVNDYVDATPWLPRVHPRETIARMFSPELLNERIIWVVEMAGEVAGYMSLDTADRVQALYLAPHARGKGLGKRLLDLVKMACPKGFDLRVYEPNEAAHRFYLREGLEEVPGSHTTDNDERIMQFVMRWRGER